MEVAQGSPRTWNAAVSSTKVAASAQDIYGTGNWGDHCLTLVVVHAMQTGENLGETGAVVPPREEG
jgi:hypothetical protein